MKKHFYLLVFSVFSISTFAANYYVSKNGSDSNAGSENAPFLTIALASSKMIAGDTCFIKEGVYRETLQPTQNGTTGKPIVYTRFQNDSVVVSAAEIVSSWQKHKGDIYRTKYTMSLSRQNMVYCNGVAMDWARWPNNTDSNKYTPQGVPVTAGSGSHLENSTIPDLNWAGGYVWYLGGHAGTSWTRTITSTTTGRINFSAVDITKWPFNPHNPTILRNNSRGQFYIFGVMDALDYPGEWYHNSTKDSLYFQAPGNVNPTGLVVEIPKRTITISLTRSYIHVIGLTAFGGKIDITGSNCVLKNGTIKNGMHVLDELNNTDAQVSDAAIYVNATKTTIENNVIEDGSISGIYVSGDGTYTTIKQNSIRNFNYVGIHASPIRCIGAYSTIFGNTIEYTGRDGIYCGATNCEIAYNDVSGCMLINNDGGMFYTVGNDYDKNNIIHHNWFHDSFGPSYADGRVAGIYLDNHSKGYVVHHNVVWNNTWAAVQINWDNWNIDIFNNSFFNCSAAMGRWENGYTIKDLVIKNNFASIAPYIGTDVSGTSNIIDAVLPFKSVANRDFRPKAGSNLMDNAEIISGITDGFQGFKPDIGAYESGFTAWKPGVKYVLDGNVATLSDVKIEETNSTVKLYPNPFQDGELNIEFITPSSNSIRIYNLFGQQIYNKSTNNDKITISRNVFTQEGVYLIKINSKGKNDTQKLIVK